MSNLTDDDDAPEPPDLTPFMEQPSGLREHPLFPLDEGVNVETRDIRFVTFRRRRSDGRVDHCPEDIPAGDIQSWADVVGPWGGGEYKAIGKDKHHKIIAWSPTEHGGWLLFDQPSRPFTLRDGRRHVRERAEFVDPPPPAPASPVAAPATLGLEALLVAMVNQSAETSRTILSAVLGQKPPEPARHEMNPIEMMRAMREFVPSAASGAAVPQTSMSEQLSTLKTLLEFTRPQPSAPEPSILGELGGLVTTVIQTDAAARASAKPPEPTERRPPSARARAPRLVHVPGVGIVDVVQPETASPPPAPISTPTLPERKPTEDTASMSTAAAQAAVLSPASPTPGVIDVEALKRDPAMVAALLRALGLSSAVVPSPSTPIETSPAPPRSAAPSPIAPTKEPTLRAPPPSHVDPPPPPPTEDRPTTAEAVAVESAIPVGIEVESRASASTLSPELLAGALRTLPGLSRDADAVAEGLVDLPPNALAMLARMFQPDEALAQSAVATPKGEQRHEAVGAAGRS